MLKVKIPKTKRDEIDGNIRLKQIDLKVVRAALLEEQNWECPLCRRNLKYIQPAQRCVDHDHSKTGESAGAVRGVLCKNCNGNEGRIRRRVLCSQGSLESIDWLENLLAYWKLHATNQTGLIHHTHKTATELRLIQNKKARERRAKKRK